VYSTKKVAAQFGLSEHLVRGMAREGLLPAENEGGRWQLGLEATEILDDLVDGEPDDDGEADEDLSPDDEASETWVEDDDDE